MKRQSREHVLRDPVYGDITIPYEVISRLIDTPEFQRLRHIRQLGMCHTVFHGAEHSRFQHAVGVMWLMFRILQHWSERRLLPLNHADMVAATVAALLHDIGHGPFSHALENVFALDDHETLGQTIVRERLAPVLEECKVDPQLVLQILTGTHPQPVFHELLSSQLDVDRMDYLRRDSLFTGTKYGLYDIDRIIYALRPMRDRDTGTHMCAISTKGVEAVEAYLFGRYFMHWQVYLHKAVRAMEVLLRVILRRARELYSADATSLYMPPNLAFLFQAEPVGETMLAQYVDIDDYDIYHAIKVWSRASDPLMADLATRFVTRKPFKAINHPGESRLLDRIRSLSRAAFGENYQWYIHCDTPKNQGYDLYEPGSSATPIRVLTDPPYGWKEFSGVTRTGAVAALSQRVELPLLMLAPEVYRQVKNKIDSDKPFQYFLVDDNQRPL